MVIIESWRSIAGFESLYEVSDLGRVRSLRGRHGKGAVLRPKIPDDPRQYPAVSLHKDGARCRRNVHALVAEAFLPPKPSPEHEVRHYDGYNGNSRADNLLWGTRVDNAADKERHGRVPRGAGHGMFGRKITGEANGAAKLTDDEVRVIRAMATAGLPQRHIGLIVGVTQGIVWRIIHRKAWAHVQ